MRFLHSTIGGLPRTFWALWVGTLINRMGTFVVPFLALYLTRRRGFTAGEAALVVSCYMAGSVCAGLVGGSLTDRLGRRATLLLSTFSAGACMMVLAFLTHFAVIAAGTLMLGFLTDLMRPAVGAMIADVCEPKDRTRAFSLLYWSINLGWAVAMVLAGTLAQTSYLALFIGDAVTTWLYGVVVIFFIPETRPALAAMAAGGGTPSAEGPSFREGLARIGQDTITLALVAVTFLHACLFVQCHATLPLHLRGHGLTEQQVGLVLATNGVLIVLLQVPVSRWLDARRPAPVLAISALLTGLGFGLNGWVEGFAPAVAGVALWTLGEILHAPVSSAVIADRSPVDLRGRYQGLFSMNFALAGFFAINAGGQIYGRSPMGLWMVCLAVGAVSALGYLVLGPRLATPAPAPSLSGGVAGDADRGAERVGGPQDRIAAERA
jgi:MFS family permease